MSAKLLRTNLQESSGHVANGGFAEGLMWALYNMRVTLEQYDEPLFLCSNQSNVAVRRTLDVLRLQGCELPSNEVGELDLVALETCLKSSGMRPCVVIANLGTTFTGAIDNVRAIKSLLVRYKPNRHCIFGDGALMGFLLPFAGLYEHNNSQEDDLRRDFESGLDGIVVNGHELLGSPQPCTIALLRREYIPKKTLEATSRNAHVVIGLWTTLRRLLPPNGKGVCNLQRAVEWAIDNAKYAERRLREVGLRPHRARGSIIVVFDHPGQLVCEEYGLTELGQKAHIVAHNLPPEKCDSLIEDIRRAQRSAKL